MVGTGRGDAISARANIWYSRGAVEIYSTLLGYTGIWKSAVFSGIYKEHIGTWMNREPGQCTFPYLTKAASTYRYIVAKIKEIYNWMWSYQNRSIYERKIMQNGQSLTSEKEYRGGVQYVHHTVIHLFMELLWVR